MRPAWVAMASRGDRFSNCIDLSKKEATGEILATVHYGIVSESSKEVTVVAQRVRRAALR
jgi:hypothetical protein